MSFLDRIRTSLRADAHGIVDALEDQALLLKQHLRDAESELERKRVRLSELENEAQRLGPERTRVCSEADRAEHDATLAVAENRDDLARFALRQLITRKNLLERIDARSAQIAEERRGLEQAVSAQQAAYDDLCARVHAHLEKRGKSQLESTLAPVSEEQVELELLRRKRESAERAQGDTP